MDGTQTVRSFSIFTRTLKFIFDGFVNLILQVH